MNDIEAEFNAALSRYEAGEDLLHLVDDFKKIINQIPNHFACLLYTSPSPRDE